MSVYAAALANGGSLDDAQPGLEFFKKLNDAGNFVPVIAKPATVAKGETPVTLRWDYNALADATALAGNPEIDVVIPTTRPLAGVYVQAISAYAPHPNAAKLWMEYLYSDEGQMIWLKGYCHPVRYDDLAKRQRHPGGDRRQAAAGRELRQGRLPDPRADQQRQEGHHRQLGHGRRRECQAIALLVHRLGRDAARDAPRVAARPLLLGLARRGRRSSLFAILFLLLPSLFLVVGSFQDAGRVHAAEHRRALHAQHPQRLLDHHRDQPGHGPRRRPLRLPPGLRASWAGCPGGCARR